MPTDPVPPPDRTVTVAPVGPETLTAGDSTTAPTPLPVGRRFGDYELLDELARGGMGVVYKARQLSVNRVVALKMILAGRFASDTDVQRFRQEAEAAANLDHPNVLPIYDVGEVEGRSYFTMKLVEGGSLAELLKSSPRTSVRGLVDLLIKVARGVHYAHQRGVLHRDLKPSNILLVEAGTPVIADFGLAKKVEGDSSLTQSGSVLGTPSYMAPEQARGSKAITTAADTYSLGAILCEVLTGRPPFRGESVAQTLRMVEEQEPARPRWLNPQCDPDLEAVALKCLEKDPASRYETAGALADDLARWLRNEPVTARRAGPGRRAWKWMRRNPAVTVLALNIVLALLAGASISAVYAVKADKRAKEAATNEQAARRQEQIVRYREEALKDVLCRTHYQQARAVRLAAQPGWRGQALDLLKHSADLRTRPRDGANLDDKTVELPDPGDLRSEAVMALIAHDARPVREIHFSAIAQVTQFSPGGRFLLQAGYGAGPNLGTNQQVTDLTTGDTRRPAAPVDAPKGTEMFALLNALALAPDGTRVARQQFGPGGAVGVFDLSSGRTAVTLRDPDGAKALPTVARAQFSSDGTKLLAVRHDKTEAEAVLWELARPEAPRVLAREPLKGDPTTVVLFAVLDGGSFAGL
ncbi:MAG TPA: serine/threonine-protein kinase, partial [Gemmataceae bacterium]|nr:serine/threonine-protein kinase [Gemmataceae bacterium]